MDLQAIVVREAPDRRPQGNSEGTRERTVPFSSAVARKAGCRHDPADSRGAAAALFGLAFGGLAVHARAWGRWRKTAVVGIALNSLVLLVAAAEVVYVALVE